jgi:hypothetical protein
VTTTLPTLGTHNLLDGAGEPTGFADYLFFTESAPGAIRKLLGDDYEVRVCEEQRDLVLAWHRAFFTPKRNSKGEVREGYKQAHGGIKKVTPHRGTYWVHGYDSEGVRCVLVVEHRINAAFPPFIRGEARYRRRMWRKHTRITLRRIKRWLRKGYRVYAGGDLNTPHGVNGYEGVLYERGFQLGHGFDRVGSSEMLEPARELSRMGSDHPRIAAAVAAGKAWMTKRLVKGAAKRP